MPDGYDAVKITTQFVAPTTSEVQFGTTLIIGTGNAVSAAEITYFNSLQELLVTYNAVSFANIASCANAMHNNGIQKFAVGIYVTKVDELYDLINVESRVGNINSVVVAGLTLDSTSISVIEPSGKPKLMKVCDDNNLIFVVAATPPSTTNSITASTIVTLRNSIISPNVYFVAYKDPAATTDIGGAVAGKLECTPPQVTMQWKDVICDVKAYFKNNELVLLENAHVNGIIRDYGLSSSFTTDKYISGTNLEENIINDISVSRSIYAIKREVQRAIINLRRNTVKLGYTNVSIGLISSTIESVLEKNLSSAMNSIGMLSSYNVKMPLLTDVSQEDKYAGVLSGIVITGSLIGEIKTFNLTLVVNLGGN